MVPATLASVRAASLVAIPASAPDNAPAPSVPDIAVPVVAASPASAPTVTPLAAAVAFVTATSDADTKVPVVDVVHIEVAEADMAPPIPALGAAIYAIATPAVNQTAAAMTIVVSIGFFLNAFFTVFTTPDFFFPSLCKGYLSGKALVFP